MAMIAVFLCLFSLWIAIFVEPGEGREKKVGGPDPRLIKNLELWHEFYLEGCYTGTCPHYNKGGVCRIVDEYTRYNRFDRLDEWLEDVNNNVRRG